MTTLLHRPCRGHMSSPNVPPERHRRISVPRTLCPEESLSPETSQWMSRNSTRTTTRRRGAALGIASAAALAVVASLAGSSPAIAAGTAPAVTRAALDPALVAGRGATVAFAEQEAEKAVSNGTVIGPA